MRRLILVGGLAVLTVSITVLALLPASYLAPVIEHGTSGRITLGDAQGTIWQGSAFIASAASKDVAITPLLPGRFQWRISPQILLGIVDVELSNPESLSDTVHATGSWHTVNISPAAITLPAERLASLGAPLNTIRPYGQMRLVWQPLQVSLLQGQADLIGSMDLQLDDMATRLSPIKPLGTYNLRFTWQGQRADVALTSKQGPLLLNGTGKLENGRLRFNGTAEAAVGHEQQLANLLNLLGQRRIINGKDVIVLSL